MKRVTIVGGGAAGVLVAINLVRNTKNPITLKLIEPKGEIGKGIAYATEDPDHLLNVPAGRMSAFEDIPNHFTVWANANENDFLSRMQYGRYLAELLQEVLSGSSELADFQHIHDSVNDIQFVGNKFLVHCEEVGIIESENVVLATGHQEVITPDSLKTLLDLPNVINNVWEQELNTELDTTAIIGTGLTFYDIALAYLRDNPKAQVYGISRNGLLPSPHLKHREMPLPVPNVARESAQAMRDYLVSVGERWREAQDGIRHELQKIWADFPDNEKQKFFDKYFRWWNVLRHRSAPDVHDQIQAHIERGSIRVLKGKISQISTNEFGFNILLDSNEQIQVEQLVNCCGNGFQITNPLLLKLISSGICSEGPLGLGIAVNTDTLEVRNSQGNTVTGMYAIGPILVGELLETTAIPEIKVQANWIAQQII